MCICMYIYIYISNINFCFLCMLIGRWNRNRTEGKNTMKYPFKKIRTLKKNN